MQKGGVIVEVLAGESKSSVESWIGNFMLKNTVVRDPDATPTQTITALVRREYTYVVDLATMKILSVYIGTTDGSKPGGVSSSLHQAMDQVEALLP